MNAVQPSAPTWVLLRGLTRGSGHWAGFPAALRARLPHARLVLLDLPGNGALWQERSPRRIAAMTSACRAALRVQGLAPPYHVLAVSMGAMVAADWATTAPAELAGCVLVNTSLRPFSPWWQRLRPRSYAALLGLALWPRSPASRERTVLRWTSRHSAAAADVEEPWTQLRHREPVSTANALRQLCAAAQFRATLVRPAVPLLLLVSAHDALADPRCTRALAQAWSAPVATHPTAGHDLTLDDPAWVAERIVRWLRPQTEKHDAGCG